MKSIADIKRKLVVGSKWSCLWECRNEGKNMGTREVNHVQSNSFGFRTIKAGGEVTTSWCDWPKKSEVVFMSDITFRIIHGDIFLTYTFVE
jgi:hypothetical protein